MTSATAPTFAGQNVMTWHGVGTNVDGAMTAAEALKIANLDWAVRRDPVYTKHADGTFYVVPDRFGIVRETDERVLGVVGGDYAPFQNTEAFEFFDTVVDQTGEAHYTAAGSLNGGRRIFMTAKIGDGFTVAGEDKHDLYLLIYNSHDGLKSFTAAATTVRLACYNMVTLALRSAQTRWSLNHRTSLEGKAQEAREALQLSYKYVNSFEKEVEKLLSVSVTTDQFKAIVEDILPQQKLQLPKNVEELLSIWENEPTVPGHNGWGVINTVTYFTDHTKQYRGEEARFKSLTDGFASRLRNTARDRVLALA